jgi:two-component system nitrogen regulation response regulator GlnG
MESVPLKMSSKSLTPRPSVYLFGGPSDELPAAPANASRIEELRPSEPPRAKSIAPHSFGGLTAYSAAMQRVLTVLERFAPTDLTVTLLGETGTGKDVLAHTLHDHSARASGPFVVFDCGAVAANLAESELFGHERGAFTGAHSLYAGAFERADGGTLFLDEVGELPLDLQPRLLRALENRRVRRVGGNEYRPVDLRVVAATNRDLKSLVAAGRFRDDLYFRLATAVVALPPLRDRLEDIPLLVARLLEDLGRPGLVVSDAALDALRAHPWPGNVRELKNTLACTLAFVEQGRAAEVEDLRLQSPSEDESALDNLLLSGHPLERIERAAIRQTLAYSRGNKVLAAQTLGIAVSTLYEKVKKYQL